MAETAPVLEASASPEAASAAPEVSPQAQLDEMRDRHLRLQAEFDNFRKRKAKEADEIRQFASSLVIESILPVLDHLDLALDASHDRTDPKWGDGIDLINKQFGDALRTFGLEEVVPAKGDRFDHDRHEAIMRTPDESVEPGSVVRCIRKGYRLRDRLLRPAQVIVAAEAEKTAESAVAANGKN